MDVYTTSSSSYTPTTSATGQTDSSSNGHNQAGSSGGWSVDQFNSNDGRAGASGGARDPQSQWGNSFSATNNVGSAQFDLVTSGVGDSSSAAAQVNGRAVDRQRQRTVLAPTGGQPSAAARRGRSPQNSSSIGTPSVPSSTTTAAPEYVMINPTRGGSDASSDQDD